MNEQERKAFDISNKKNIIKYSVFAILLVLYLIIVLILSDLTYTSHTYSKSEFKNQQDEPIQIGEYYPTKIKTNMFGFTLDKGFVDVQSKCYFRDEGKEQLNISTKTGSRKTQLKVNGQKININCMNATDINHPSYKLYKEYNLCVIWLFVLSFVVVFVVFQQLFCKKLFVVPPFKFQRKQKKAAKQAEKEAPQEEKDQLIQQEQKQE